MGIILVLFLFPQVLDSVMTAAIFVVMAILVIVLGIALVGMFLILPMYAKKGVVYQTNASYDLDDVKDVDGKMEGKE